MKTSWINKENLILALVWLLIYAYDPLYMYYANMVSDFDVRWETILELWSYTTAFLILFLVHHYLLVPKSFAKKKVWQYVTGVILIFSAFTAFILCNNHNHFEEKHERHEGRQHRDGEERTGLGRTFGEYQFEARDSNRTQERTPEARDTHRQQPDFRPDMGHGDKRHRNTPPLLLAPPDLARLVIALMMIIADLGVAAWFNEQKLRQRLLLLEKQALQQEISQLHYQINPHFFMNTLNNIHALVDIDQDRAKRAIVELSGMMRYSLYEGNDNMTPLMHEVEFLKQYISLMKLRFSNKVALHCEMPESAPSEVMIPPLLLATFIENAFKYGISYQHPSYISIMLEYNKEMHQIHFVCENSRQNTPTVKQDEHHGLGLVNVRKRLDLQYANSYKLVIDEHDESRFIVDLTLTIDELK